MKLLEPLKINVVYWLMAALLGLEIVQALIKYFSPYYFSAFSLGAFSLLMLLLGLKLGMNKALVLVLALLGLLISTLKFFIIWN